MQKPSRLRQEHLTKLNPLTGNQERVFKSFKENNQLVLSGSAGTGKTFLSLYLGLDAVLQKQYEKVVIVRSALPTRDMGFLPGEKKEKEAAYLDPYILIVNELFRDKEGWKKMVQFNHIEFLTTSFIRGLTLTDSVVIVDEAQNCNFHELCSIITRIGNNCRFILCEDYYQSDFTRNNDKEGFHSFINILNNMKYFDHIEFQWSDIVRSGLVRDFIMTKEMLEKGK